MTELAIESLAYGGDAIAHLDDGRAVFVSGACPGDRALVEITEERERFARGRVVEILEPSSHRVTAPCPYFGSCGGCSWQHIAYDLQCTAKRAAVVDALARIGRVDDADALVAQTRPSSRPLGYRNKVELVTNPASRRLELGYHRAASDQVVPVESCLLLPKKHQRAPRALAGALRYLSGREDLGINRVGYRVAASTSDVEVALWTAPGAFPRKAVATTLMQAVPATSIVRVLTKERAGTRKIAGVEVLSGKGHWRERLAGHEFAISAPSFFQVNTPGADVLIGLVIDALEPDGSDRVLDLYSGAGTFTLPLAELSGEVVAVESAGSAVRDLRRNLESAQLWAEVVGGDAAREIAELGHFDLVIVDPPRSGLAPEVISALASTRPRGIAYVSCDPATLARDTKALAEVGFELLKATPVDLFPQTYHIETVAHFAPVHHP